MSKGQIAWLALPLMVGVVLWQGNNWWSAMSAPVQPQIAAKDAKQKIRIPEGTSVKGIGRTLAAAGLIRSTQAWDLWSRWLQLRQKLGQIPPGNFQAGLYEISPGQSLPEVAAEIRDGQVVQTQFTIPEGWSLRKMAQYFEAQGFFKAQDFLTAASQIPRDRFPWLPAGLPHLEGFLFPDTYSLPSGEITPQDVINVMLYQFEQQALPLFKAGDQTWNRSLKDWVAFASIIEKEAVVPEERTLISGVLAHRLRIDMKLEVDPTVEYGLGITQTPDRTLTFAEVGTPSPYNSYMNPGLPPTPIASPGKASLSAALTPQATNFLFYVARYDGTHVFSTTFKDHLNAQDKIHDAREASAKPTP
jgi:UPF0755 protein